VAAREKDHGLAVGRKHELKADTASIRLYLRVHLIGELFRLLLMAPAHRITDLLDEIDSIGLDAILRSHLLLHLLLLSLLVPDAPLLPVQLLLVHSKLLLYV
jgi:hypothetical protein